MYRVNQGHRFRPVQWPVRFSDPVIFLWMGIQTQICAACLIFYYTFIIMNTTCGGWIYVCRVNQDHRFRPVQRPVRFSDPVIFHWMGIQIQFCAACLICYYMFIISIPPHLTMMGKQYSVRCCAIYHHRWRENFGNILACFNKPKSRYILVFAEKA